MFSRLSVRGLLFVCTLVLTACGGGGGGGGGSSNPEAEPQLQQQTIVFAQAGPLTVEYGQALTNTASGGAGSGAISYNSGNSALATVDSSGNIVTLQPGSVTITATKAADAHYAAAGATYSLNIVAATRSIVFTDPGPVKLTVNQSFWNRVEIPGGGESIYSSSDTSVATVDSGGQVWTVGPGTAVITLRLGANYFYKEATGVYSIVVSQRQDIAFARTGPVALAAGDTLANPASGPGSGAITYSSSDTAVATVDPGTGVVSAVGNGTAVITADKAADSQYAAGTGTYTVKVNGVAMRVWIGANDSEVRLGASASGAALYRSTDANCNIANYLTCANGQLSTLGTNAVTDTAATQSRIGYYVLKRGAAQASVQVTTEHFAGRYGLQVLAFANQLWVIGGHDGDTTAMSDVWASSDGVSWIQKTAAAGFPGRWFHQAVVFNNRMWVIGGSDLTSFGVSEIWSSADGVSWTREATSAPFGYRTRHQVVVYHNKLWLIGGNSGGNSGTRYNDVWSSSDGIHWTQETASADFAPREDHRVVVYDDKMWLIGGCAGSCNFSFGGKSDVWTSTDGVHWTQQAADTDGWFLVAIPTVVFNNQLCLVSNNSIVSSNGTKWTSLASGDTTLPGRYYAQAAVFKDRVWMIGGFAPTGASLDDVWSSNDGGNWTQHTSRPGFSPRFEHQVVEFKNQLWMAAGTAGDVAGATNDTWSSADGVLWRQGANLPDWGRHGHQIVAFRDRLWFIGGAGNGGGLGDNDNNDVWSSADGIDWRLEVQHAQFEARSGHRVVVFANKLWLIGGVAFEGISEQSDVWSSDDGITWTRTALGEFPARSDHEVVVYNNKLWVIGGYGGAAQLLNDVWSSSDGVHWAEVTASAAFSPRLGLRVAAYDNQMWLIGGGAGSSGTNDVWVSTDGAIWTQKTAAAAFPARARHQMLVYGNKLLLIGGAVNGWEGPLNDVWSSSDGIEWREGRRWVFDL